MNIGLLGCGTVGTGVYETLINQKERLNKLYGEPIEIKKILVKDKRKNRALEGIEALMTTDAYEILDDSSIEMVVEVMGGVDEAYEYISYALRNRKHIVTANKAVVARYMETFLTLAEENEVAFLFEASVGGGIPLLKPLKQCTLLNEFSEIKGILNGTSNFILTKMMDENLDFHGALKIAQGLGYAEADPSDDIEGADVARKLAIVSTIVFKTYVDLEKVTYRGISEITKKDINQFKKMNCSVKLLGKAINKGDDFTAIVEPVLFRKNTQFEKVKDAYNMVSVKGDNLREIRFYGEGAGKKATANAVICDILDVVSGDYLKSGFYRDKSIKSSEKKLISGQYYIRITLNDPNEKGLVDKILSKVNLTGERIHMGKDYVFITESISAESIRMIERDIKQLNLEVIFLRFEEE